MRRWSTGYRDAMTYALRRADDPDFELAPGSRSRHSRPGLGGVVRPGCRALPGQAGVRRRRPQWRPALHSPGSVEPRRTLLSTGDRRTSQLRRCPRPCWRPLRTLPSRRFIRSRTATAGPRGSWRASRCCGAATGGPSSRRSRSGGVGIPRTTTQPSECWGREWDSTADVTGFVHAHLTGPRGAGRGVRGRPRRAGRHLGRSRATSPRGSATLRGVEALYDAFLGRAVTNRYYRETAAVSSVTAATDLSRLAAAGLLACSRRGQHDRVRCVCGPVRATRDRTGAGGQNRSRRFRWTSAAAALIATLKWRVEER